MSLERLTARRCAIGNVSNLMDVKSEACAHGGERVVNVFGW